MELAELRLAKLRGYSLVSGKALDLLKSERHTREVEKDLRMVFYLTQCLIRCLFHRIHDSLAWRSLFLLCGVSCSNNIGFLRKLNFELSGEELRISFLERDVRRRIHLSRQSDSIQLQRRQGGNVRGITGNAHAPADNSI